MSSSFLLLGFQFSNKAELVVELRLLICSLQVESLVCLFPSILALVDQPSFISPLYLVGVRQKSSKSCFNFLFSFWHFIIIIIIFYKKKKMQISYLLLGWLLFWHICIKNVNNKSFIGTSRMCQHMIANDRTYCSVMWDCGWWWFYG